MSESIQAEIKPKRSYVRKPKVQIVSEPEQILPEPEVIVSLPEVVC